jgi:hypothetical protein
MLNEGEEIQGLIAQGKLGIPVLAVDAGSGDFSHHTMTQVAEHVSAATLADVGHRSDGGPRGARAGAPGLLPKHRRLTPNTGAAAHLPRN